MEQVKILIETESPLYEEVKKELQQNLTALKTIKLKTIQKPTEPGTLGPVQIVGFIIENYDKIIPLVTAILNLVNLILPKKKRQTREVVVIKIGENKLSLPASSADQKKFLKKLE